MDPVKDAFKKVREDISTLREQMIILAEELANTQEELHKIVYNFNKNSFESTSLPTSRDSTDRQTDSTIRHINQTDSTHLSTDNSLFKPLKPKNYGISIGNKGVPTDRQTNQQTDRHIEIQAKIGENSINEAFEILNSLDNLKKEIRLNFKRLTDQEMAVFSTIYQLEEEGFQADYREVSSKLSLSESSVRDYVSRLIKKGIPVDKTKINNKMVLLSISQNLRKIAPLSTIIQLRDL